MVREVVDLLVVSMHEASLPSLLKKIKRRQQKSNHLCRKFKPTRPPATLAKAISVKFGTDHVSGY